MTASASFTINGAIGGKTIYKTFTRESDHPNPYIDIDLPAGKTVSSWVKTDANTAAGALTAGHGLSSGKVDVYWLDTDGVTPKQRHGVDMTVNAIALDGGAGDDFPATAETTVVVTPQVTITVHSDGDRAVALIVCVEYSSSSETRYSGVDFQDTGGTTVKYMLLGPNEPAIWWSQCIYSNPLTGSVIEGVKASNGSADNDATVSILILEDATP